MGKSKKNKNVLDDGDPYKVGTVLFTSGSGMKHEEIWDDSELINHWDRTVEQYRRQYGEGSTNQPFEDKIWKTQNGHVEKKKPVLRKKVVAKETRTMTDHQPAKNSDEHNKIPSSDKHPTAPSMPPIPPTPTNNQEELLNLMMAWYYCGYYTGVYQAQQK